MLITSNALVPAARFKQFWGPENFAGQKHFLFHENKQYLAIITPVSFVQGLEGCGITRFVCVAVVLQVHEPRLRVAGEPLLVAGQSPLKISIIVRDYRKNPRIIRTRV